MLYYSLTVYIIISISKVLYSLKEAGIANVMVNIFFCGEDLEMVSDITNSRSELMVVCSFKESLL